MADKAFERVHGWFAQAVEEAIKGVANAGERDALRKVLWSLVDPVDRNVAPPAADPAAFRQPNIAGSSLSVAAIVVGETLVAIDPLKKIIDALGGGNLGDAKDAVRVLVDQIKRAVSGARVHPSGFGIGKLLLTLSGDIATTAPADPAQPQAKRLAEALTSTATQQLGASTAMGVQTMFVGAVLDTAFDKDPAQSLKDWAGFSAGTLAGAVQPPDLKLPFPKSGGVPGADGDVQILKFDIAEGVRARLSGGFSREKDDGPTRKLVLALKAAGELELRWAPAVKLEAQNLGIDLDVALKKKSGNNGAVSIPEPAGDPAVRLQIDELGAGLTLSTPPGGSQLAPAIRLRAKDGKIIVKVGDSLLKQVLGEQIEVEFSIEAMADAAGGFRLKDGTALRVNLPIQKLPTGPFKLQLITLAVEPKDNFAQIETELSVSAGVDLGPFKGSVERIGAKLLITTANGEIAFEFKPPTGLGLSLDAGVVKGGGYLSLDPELGEYKGALELKIAAIGVKALGMLNTKRPPGNNWSLLLLIFGNFPPIQLSWGFTLTGVGGLIGVQHTADTTAMAQQLGSGGLDAVLFPKDVAGNAPQIFETLKTLFPFKAGGFIIGPMLEVGWGTPNLVAIRLGVLIEASQIAILGQLVVQVPPLVDKSLAILRLQIDFVGVIVFDPFKIAFDGKLRDSRVGFITLTGQFAFRAAFGSKPTFLLSAGGFHPRFADIPPDIPMPFDRIGAGFSIGIVGVSVKGYFAVTAATVQAGCELKVWGDVGVASFDAGLGFDAICYLQPKFYFEVDFRAWAHAEAFGIGFGVRLEGLLKGPGRWRIRGVGEIDLGFFGSVSVEFDESWGDDRDTPRIRRSAFALLKDEVDKRDNWNVQLTGDGEHLVTVARREGEKDALAHPMAALVFTQRSAPLRRRLDKLGEADIDGPRTLDIGGLTFNGAVVPNVRRETQRENFAASQFLEMSDDDKLTHPSFEAMDAGEKLSADEFEFDPAALVSCPVDWESRELSPAPKHREWRIDALVLGAIHTEHVYARAPQIAGWMVATGAVARSSLRAAERLRPPDAQPLSVKEQPVAAVADKLHQGAVSAAATGAWAARETVQRLAGGSVRASELQVVESYELA
ncbi:DUF6603 domain-containing protein [Methylibium sp.]|uniref:DUF6603 domain-containing protein n=1 Tax=Methylibium sp. TaxID=2067992 RepID=UPI003D0A182D